MVDARLTMNDWERALSTTEAIDVREIKVIVEKHPDTYVAYPIGLHGVVVGEGDTYAEALEDVTSAIRFHIETFGLAALEPESVVLEAFVAEARVGT